MTRTSTTRNPRKVRASVIRRTVVGSLVVMLSPFLTVLDNDADASTKARKPIILNSAPVAERHISDEEAISFSAIQSSLLKEAGEYWTYENVIPEAATRG